MGVPGPINSSYEVARQFFAGEAKKHHRMREQRDVGYVNMPHIKEFYQVCTTPRGRCLLFATIDLSSLSLWSDAIYQEPDRSVAKSAGELQGGSARVL
jgi:hypothetical protein